MFITIYVITAIILCIIMSPRRRYSFLNSTIHIIIIPTIISSTNRHGPPTGIFDMVARCSSRRRTHVFIR